MALGRTVPLVRPLEITPETHGPKGIGYAELPPPSRPLSDRHGADVIVEEARRRPGEITMVTLGPLTNLAVALEREPDLPRLLGRLVIMGGSYRSPGNTAPTTEWNIHCDPEAAMAVLEAWTRRRPAPNPGVPDPSPWASTSPSGRRSPPTMSSPWPVGPAAAPTTRSPSPGARTRCTATRSVASDPVVRFVADALRFYMEFHSRYDGFYGAFIHDPLALAAALDPGLVRSEALTVDIELDGTLTTGETVTDWRRVWGRPPNLDIAVEAEAEEFLARLVERIGGLAARLAAG